MADQQDPSTQAPGAASTQEPSLSEQIAAHNNAVDTAEGGDAPAAATTPPATPPTPLAPPPPPVDEAEAAKDAAFAADKGPEKPGSETPAAEAPATDTALAPAPAKADAALEGSFRFAPDISLDDFTQSKTAFLEQYEVPQPVMDLLDLAESKLQDTSGFEEYGGKTRVDETFSALDSLYESNIEGSSGSEIPVPNVKPLLQLLTTKYKNEFSGIAAEIMMADSLKYKGASVLQELLMDVFTLTPSQLGQVHNFLVHQTPLPKIEDRVSLPAGIDEKLKDAYWRLSERRRYEIESMAKELAQLEADVPTLDAYYKKEGERKLAELHETMADEIAMLRDVQAGIDSTNQMRAATDRQREADREAFNVELQTEYLTETFEISENFATAISAQLTFLDESMRLTSARDISARVANALAFRYDDEFKYHEEPTAKIYADQLKKEGIKFDFAKGSHLLHEHLLAVRKVKVLKRTNGSPEAIAAAEREKAKVLKEIKAGQVELLGQIATKYVASASGALEEKIAKTAEKKQAARARTAYVGAPAPGRDSLDKVNADRKALNERIDREAAEGGGYDDVLFDRS